MGVETARSAALSILLRVEESGAFAAPLLDAAGARLPRREAALLRALVRGVLRNRLRLDGELAGLLDRPLQRLDVPVREALRLGAFQLVLMDRIPPHAAVSETVSALKALAPRGTGLVNAVLRRLGRESRGGARGAAPGEPLVRRLSLETSHPEWLVERWVRHLGEDAATGALRADQEDSPVDLLMERAPGDTYETVAEALAGEGLEVRKSRWAPLAATLLRGEPGQSALVRSGAVAVVDAAAQALVELVRPAGIVVDLTAAPGGKTRTLLARGKARRVVALERNGARLARMARALTAGGRRGEVLTVLADAGSPPLPRGSFASVLLDAPCSGTGTLRKNPEIRWRLRPSDLTDLARLQVRLLSSAVELLMPGGRLVYATCSLEPEENEEVVAAILGLRPDVGPAPDLGGELPGPLLSSRTGPASFRILPGESNDGFCASVLERRPGRRQA